MENMHDDLAASRVKCVKHCCIKYASDWLRERCEFSIIIRESIEAKLI